MTRPDGLLDVGRLGRAHGIRGAIVVHLSSDNIARMAVGSRVFDGTQWLTVVTSRSQPQSRWVVQFEGIDNRTRAEALTGRSLFAEPVAVDDALWVHELIGSRVVEVSGIDRGRCVAVVQNPAHDLIEVDGGHLVPVTFVTSFADGVVTIDAPEGLFDLLD